MKWTARGIRVTGITSIEAVDKIIEADTWVDAAFQYWLWRQLTGDESIFILWEQDGQRYIGTHAEEQRLEQMQAEWRDG